MDTNTTTSCETYVGRPVAPEDVRPGDFVGILTEIVEFPSFLWCHDSQLLAPNELVRVQWHPHDGGTPLKVKAICLPFVYVKTTDGRWRTLDVRQCQLVRLSSDCARSVWRALKRKTKR